MRRPTIELRVIGILAIMTTLVLGPSLSAHAQRRLVSRGVYEGETLVQSGKTVVNAGNVSAQPMADFGSGWSGNAQLFWGGGQVGAVLDLIVDVPEEAIYAVEVNMTRAPDYGKLRIQVDGNDVPEVFDGYAPTVVPSGSISVGTFNLQAGARKISFMIVGKNEKATGFFAGIDFVRLTKKPVLPSKTQTPDTSTANWRVAEPTITPEPTQINELGTKSYMDGDQITVRCFASAASSQAVNDVAAQLTIADNGAAKDSVGITASWIDNNHFGAARSISYKINGTGSHQIKCAVAEMGKSQQFKVTDEKTVTVTVVGLKPVESKWATAPIIVTPAENQKMSGGNIVVQSYAPAVSHCADGGVIGLDWQYFDSSNSTWQPLKMLSSLWKCVPGGSKKDISGMNPGLYKVRARETNVKYDFTSDWSGWVTFEILAK